MKVPHSVSLHEEGGLRSMMLVHDPSLALGALSSIKSHLQVHKPCVPVLQEGTYNSLDLGNERLDDGCCSGVRSLGRIETISTAALINHQDPVSEGREDDLS